MGCLEGERLVEDLCEDAAKRGLKIIRDRGELAVGDSIKSFMQRISEGDRISFF